MEDLTGGLFCLARPMAAISRPLVGGGGAVWYMGSVSPREAECPRFHRCCREGGALQLVSSGGTATAVSPCISLAYALAFGAGLLSDSFLQMEFLMGNVKKLHVFSSDMCPLPGVLAWSSCLSVSVWLRWCAPVSVPMPVCETMARLQCNQPFPCAHRPQP